MTTITDKLALPPFIRAEVEKAIEAAKNQRGMSTHDGKATIGHDKLAYLLAVIDAHASQQAAPSEERVEAAAMALARMSYGHQALDSDAAEWREHARAVLQAADAVSAVPDGYVLVPEKATPLIREALRIGMRREVPSDELCDIRWRAAIAAAAPGEQKGGV